MSNFCPDLSSDAAVAYVSSAQQHFTQLGAQTYQLAIGEMKTLSDISLAPVQTNISFDFDEALAGYVRPTAPVIDPTQFQFRDPGDVPNPPTFQPGQIQDSGPPVFDQDAPSLLFPVQPDPPDVPVPDAPPNPDPLTFPDTPNFALPPLPTLDALQVPAFPTLNIPTFTETSPIFVEPPFNQNWSFTASDYTSSLLTQLQGQIGVMLQGQQALPPAIQRAILDQGRDRIEVETQRAIDQAYDEFAARGFSEPPGMLNDRVIRVRQQGQDQIADINRTVTLKNFDEALANLRLAVERGVALEGVTIQLFVEEQRFALEAAKFARETDVAILNARISVYNAQLDGYKTDASVYASRIQAELSKLEVLKSEIDIERLRGEFNQQKVQIYSEETRGLLYLARFYSAQVQAVEVKARTELIPIQIYEAQVRAYGERWRANVAQWQAYTSAVQGETAKADVYRTLAQVFGIEMSGYATTQNTRIEQQRLQISENGQLLAAWKAQLERKAELLDAEKARLGAAASYADVQARIYTAEGAVEQYATAATDRSFELGLESEKADVQAQLENARLAIQQNIQLLTQTVEIQRARGQIASQLSASTMSAVHYGATVSSGRSQSSSCSQLFSFSGEIADAESD